jgi:hypothetical protein
MLHAPSTDGHDSEYGSDRDRGDTDHPISPDRIALVTRAAVPIVIDLIALPVEAFLHLSAPGRPGPG